MTGKPFRVGRSRTGLGLFAVTAIKKRAVIVEYRGRRIPTKTARELEMLRPNRYLFEINARWTIDGSTRRNLARYVNHACKPNAEAELLRGEMVYRARRNIREGEEITIDYGKEYFDLYLKQKGCLCLTCIEKRAAARRLARVRRMRKARASAAAKTNAKKMLKRRKSVRR